MFNLNTNNTFNLTTNTHNSYRSNKVLRQTYLLLAISLLPTAIGAWIGILTGFSALFTGFLGFIFLLLTSIVFIFAIEKTKNSVFGIPVLLLFTFFMGLILSPLIGKTLGYRNGAELISVAFLGTASIFFGMSTLATVIKKDLSSMGKFLFVGVILLIFATLLNVFFQSSTLMIVLSILSIAIFSAYMLYDVKQIIDGGERNYISATLSLYLNLFNIFQSLLALLGIFGGEKH